MFTIQDDTQDDIQDETQDDTQDDTHDDTQDDTQVLGLKRLQTIKWLLTMSNWSGNSLPLLYDFYIGIAQLTVSDSCGQFLTVFDSFW